MVPPDFDSEQSSAPDFQDLPEDIRQQPGLQLTGREPASKCCRCGTVKALEGRRCIIG